MSRVVFLLDEYSMAVLLEGLLPRIYPDLPFLCISHEGKQDLEKSIPRKLRAWQELGVRLVIVRDKDEGDCRRVKAALYSLCQAGRREDSLVRIACHELEAWYLGDTQALANAFGNESLRGLGRKARLRDPDTVSRPSDAIRKLVPEFQKVSGARLMAQHLSRAGNRSRSYQVLLEGVDAIGGFQR